MVLFALALCGAFITSIVMGTKADPEIVHAVMYVIITGLGMSGAEKFAPK
jgi:NADH:ubiquinone oxidoreductase subunit 6 (subunit J)